MILVCPSCIARYRIEVEALGATGRRVKCSRCGYIWHAEPPGHTVEVIHAEPEAAAPTGVPAPEPDPAPARAQLPVPAGSARRPRGHSLWTWITCFLLLALCVVGYEARHPIANEWPWLVPVYEGFGIVVGEGQGAQPARPE